MKQGTTVFRTLAFSLLALGILFISLTLNTTLVTAQEPTPPPNTCMGDICGVASPCTAKDVAISSLTTIGVKDYCTSTNDTGTYTFQMELLPQANERYDVGFWISTDGGDAAYGSCYSGYLKPPLATTLPLAPTPIYGPPFWDLEVDKNGVSLGDMCGDVRANQRTYYVFDLTLPCVDADANGTIDPISSCLAWDQNAGNNCPANNACPGTGSKCNCAAVPIEVVLYNIDLSLIKSAFKTTLQPGDVFTYTLTITNNDLINKSTGFTITDDLPEWLHFVSYSGANATCSTVADATPENGGESITCTVTQDLLPSSTYSLDFTVQLDQNAVLNPLSVENTACTTGFEMDPVTTNNCDAVTVPITSTAVDLLNFEANGAKRSIVLRWETATEVDNIGFNLYRSSRIDGEKSLVNSVLIPTNLPPGSTEGSEYELIDTNLRPKATYYYWLEDVDIFNTKTLHGPVSAKSEAK